MPMTFDQYGKCSYGCLYCFARFRKAIGTAKVRYADDSVVNSVNPARVKRLFTGESTDQFTPLIQQRKVMQWGGMADPFCNFEQKFGVGLDLLKFFGELRYPICFSTKGTWWSKDRRYVDLFKEQSQWNVKVSIITMDEKKRAVIEPRDTSTKERLKTIERIASWDCGGATLRLRPFIIGASNPRHVELIRSAASAGATAVSTEFMCVEERSSAFMEVLPTLSKACGFNIHKFYKEHSYSTGYFRLCREVKRQYIDEMESTARACGMRFYVSDAHFKERCDNGSCCGLPPDWNYSCGQWTHALQVAKRNGRVFWSDISQHLDFAKTFLYRQAKGYNTKSTTHRAAFYTHTMFEYMRWLWNNPKAGQSPYTMYEGIISPCEKDNEGNLVYEYTEERSGGNP